MTPAELRARVARMADDLASDMRWYDKQMSDKSLADSVWHRTDGKAIATTTVLGRLSAILSEYDASARGDRT